VTICIIPARSKSERIKNKNIINFFEKPIIAYAIDVAKKSKIFKRIIVSTDSKKIAKIAINYGAEVPFLRSKKNSDDKATTIDVVNEVILNLDKENTQFQNICILYLTAVLTTPQMIIESFDLLGDYDSIMPIVPFSSSIWRSFKISNNTLSYIWPENEKKRTQDLEATYFDAGQWYWLKNNKIMHNSVLGKTPGFYKVNEIMVQDIDTPLDWKMAELKFKFLRGDV
jgi:N-acylneuraminate cytidylyltransferase